MLKCFNFMSFFNDFTKTYGAGWCNCGDVGLSVAQTFIEVLKDAVDDYKHYLDEAHKRGEITEEQYRFYLDKCEEVMHS